MSRSLNKVMLDKNLRAELIQNGKEQLNKFNSEKNIKKTIDIIQNLKL